MARRPEGLLSTTVNNKNTKLHVIPVIRTSSMNKQRHRQPVPCLISLLLPPKLLSRRIPLQAESEQNRNAVAQIKAMAHQLYQVKQDNALQGTGDGDLAPHRRGLCSHSAQAQPSTPTELHCPVKSYPSQDRPSPQQALLIHPKHCTAKRTGGWSPQQNSSAPLNPATSSCHSFSC